MNNPEDTYAEDNQSDALVITSNREERQNDIAEKKAIDYFIQLVDNS